MANDKKYLEVFNDGQDDLYIYDHEAHEQLDNIPSIYATKTALTNATIIPIDIDNLTPSTTFVKNSILGINGIMYRSVVDTSDFPVVLLVQDGHIVYDLDENGNKAFVVDDYTLSEDWEIWTDAGIPRTLDNMTAQQTAFMEDEQADMADFKAQVNAAVATAIKSGTKITSTGGTQYTVDTLLTALADLMDKTIVINE